MKKLAVLAIAATSLVGTAAFAQGVSVGVPGVGGVTVGDGGYRGDGYYRRDRDRDYRRSYNRDDRVIVRRDRDRDYDRRGGDRVYIDRD